MAGADDESWTGRPDPRIDVPPNSLWDDSYKVSPYGVRGVLQRRGRVATIGIRLQDGQHPTYGAAVPSWRSCGPRKTNHAQETPCPPP